MQKPTPRREPAVEPTAAAPKETLAEKEGVSPRTAGAARTAPGSTVRPDDDREHASQRNYGTLLLTGGGVLIAIVVIALVIGMFSNTP